MKVIIKKKKIPRANILKLLRHSKYFSQSLRDTISYTPGDKSYDWTQRNAVGGALHKAENAKKLYFWALFNDQQSNKTLI